MNKFLRDLENELKKLKINKDDIKEILADHEEMIEQALKDGLTDEEIELKFGDPNKLAKELKSDDGSKEVNTDEYTKQMGSGDTKGYELFQSLPVTDGIKNVKVSLVSADIKYYPHEGESVEVYMKNVTKPENYSVGLKNGEFFFKRVSSKSIFNFGSRKSASFIVKVPKGLVYNEFTFSTVSGDAQLSGVESNELFAKSTSGDYEIKGLKVQELKVTTVSGDVELEDFNAQEVHFSAVSGDFEISNGEISGNARFNTVSGDFEVENVEAEYVDFNTVSGDLEAQEFYINRVDLKSVSGDVKIKNEDKERVIEVGRKRTLSGDIKIR